MIDLTAEPLITLAGAARLLPRRRGKKVAKQTLLRWVLHGHHGVFLDALRQPCGWLTSAAAVGRFLAELARQERARASSSVPRVPQWVREYWERQGIKISPA
jgi:hypothetical protein